jgi:hypothetical protein
MSKYLDNVAIRLQVKYALCLDNKSFRRKLKELKISDDLHFVNSKADATVHWFENPDDVCCALVCIDNYKGRDPIGIAGLLLHEAVHIWQHHKEVVPEGHTNDELEATSIQKIAQELMWSYVEQTKS